MADQIIFKVPAYEEVAPGAQVIFDQLKKATGKVPNLYAVIGHSANALGSYMAWVQAQAKGTFHAREREGIYLIVSQLNDCEYCLAAHTQSAIRNHWTEEETLQLRAGTLPDPRWRAIYDVVKSVIEHRGAVADDTLRSFYGTGYTEEALMDLMALISVMSFTNYVYRLTKIPVDSPPAKPLV